MDAAQVSLTALGASLMRAVHTRLDHPALISDPWGDRLINDAEGEALREFAMRGLSPAARQQLEALGPDGATAALARGHPSYGTIIMRARYAEDALASAVARGARQYVIVGAGMDSFALRRPDFAREVQIFEIDHPATQGFKLDRLEQCGVDRPVGVRYIVADLSLEGLDAALDRSGFDRNQRSVFAWLGVTAYLSRDANLQTLRAIADCGAPGSELVFTYLERGLLESTDDEAVALREMFASVGEAWVCGFDPSTLGDDLRSVGLVLVSAVSRLSGSRLAGLGAVGPGRLGQPDRLLDLRIVGGALVEGA
jgi:methyltransferase (TIGR00027 family)